jgi:hypothetical protein
MPLVTPRTWVVGEVVTAAYMNAEVRDQINALISDRPVAIKTSATSRASNTTPTADPHLQITLVANATYVVEGHLRASNANGVGDIRMTMSAPSGASGGWTVIGPSVGTSTEFDTHRIKNWSFSSVAAFGFPNSDILGLPLQAYVTTGASSGVLSIDWSQQVSDPTNTIMNIGSWLRARRIS